MTKEFINEKLGEPAPLLASLRDLRFEQKGFFLDPIWG